MGYKPVRFIKTGLYAYFKNDLVKLEKQGQFSNLYGKHSNKMESNMQLIICYKGITSTSTESVCLP